MGERLFSSATLIGTGRSGEVHVLGFDKVIKIFHDDRDEEHVTREFHNTQAVREAGLPVPRALEITRIGYQWAIVYERVQGQQLERYLIEHPKALEEKARQFARLHLRLHQHSVESLPWQISRYLLKIQQSTSLPFDIQQRAMQALCALPLGNVVCHGDFTPPNVVVRDDGEVMVIDWPNASSGNPMACVVETALNLIRKGDERSPKFMQGAYFFRQAYLEECARLRPGFAQDFARWEPVVAAAMLHGVSYQPEAERLRAIVEAGVSAGLL